MQRKLHFACAPARARHSRQHSDRMLQGWMHYTLQESATGLATDCILKSGIAERSVAPVHGTPHVPGWGMQSGGQHPASHGQAFQPFCNVLCCCPICDVLDEEARARFATVTSCPRARPFVSGQSRRFRCHQQGVNGFQPQALNRKGSQAGTAVTVNILLHLLCSLLLLDATLPGMLHQLVESL